MDATEVHLWASRVHSAKHLSAVHSAHLTSSDSEVNEDPRTYFTCPFCYADTELSLLCRHLQEEHCFDVKDAVCPVCALNLGKDVVGHFEVHHANSLKNRRKSQKSSFWNSSSVRELTSFYGFTTRSDRVNAHDSSPDPVLSPFICRVPHLQVKGEPSRNTCSITDASITLEIESSKAPTSNESKEKDSEEKRQRAEFFQQLIMSAIF
ncbi:hypothetical protein Nepgr_023349 [Nepenthes gracilis]|uniref:Uncharacterized protein n=1 Tax=Nepenthes gracilis TaxID=150966 RepID=A0AAD3XXM5_NEPGR|nr:hypothetical protein Nepgr_023349 [Nepenthes gracilis]